MEIIRLELPTFFDTMTVNAWFVPGEEPTLIDCGEKTEKTWDVLTASLKKLGYKIQDIQKIIITHGHLDHMGMANRIIQNSDARVWVNELVFPWTQDLRAMLEKRSAAIMSVIDPNLPEKEAQEFRGFGYPILAPFWDEIPEERINIFPLSGHIDIGGENWVILYTPGHCVNQTCFLHPGKGLLFSADMLMKIIPNPIIDALPQSTLQRTKSLPGQVASYNKLLELDFNMVYPGHFQAFENGKALVQKQLAKIDARKNHCLQSIQSGHHSVIEIVHQLYPGRVNNATIFMVLGLLDILLEKNEVQRIDKNGKFQYFCN